MIESNELGGKQHAVAGWDLRAAGDFASSRQDAARFLAGAARRLSEPWD
jgi:hypothetical protein